MTHFRHIPRWLGLAVGLGLALAFTSMPRAQAEPSWQPYTFTPRGHAEVVAERMQLTVPLRHAAPQGPTLTLRVVRLPAKQRRSGASPVVYLAGGPGGSGVAAALGARWPVFDAVRQERDVILLDQRGTGESTPPPACPHKVDLDPKRAHDAAQQLQAYQQTAARCMAHWRGLGLDPDAFNTAESAADLRALQQAVAADTFSLWGMSYGTHLAFAALKQPGLKIDRLLLMGSEGPDQTIKLPLDADALLLRVGTAAGMPDLTERLRRQIEALRREPKTIERPAPMVMGAFDLQLVVVAMLARRQTSAAIPAMLSQLETGQDEIAARVLARLIQGSDTIPLMSLAMDIASGATAARRAEVRTTEQRSVLGGALNFPYPQIGEGLGVKDLGDAFRADPRSDRPTQFISGTFDGRTPVANVTALERGFANRGHWIVEGAGHDDELWLTSPHLPALIVRFFNGEAPSDLRLSAR